MNVEEMSLEKLKSEFVLQERLICSYQKENERLTKLLKDEELRINSNQALFYDQQELLNRELNKLRNEANSTEVQSWRRKKSAEELRLELEQDGKIRFLQEKLAEMEEQTLNREKAFLQKIHRYQQQCSELRQALNKLEGTEKEKLQVELKGKDAEIEDLRSQLRSAQSYRSKADSTERNLLLCQRQLNYVRKELVSHGMNAADVQSFLTAEISLPEALTKLSHSVFVLVTKHQNVQQQKKIR